VSLRVIHVAAAREYRGGQNQVRLLALALRRHPMIDQVVITGRGSELARRLDGRVPLVTPAWNTALDLRALLATLRAAGDPDRPTVLHAHDAHALILAGLAARWRRARLVVTRRVDFHLRRPGFWLRADRVIAISRAVRDVLVSDGIPPDRISVVHSGIDPDEVRTVVRLDIRRHLGLPETARVALNVAALVGHKDQATLLAAAASLRDTRPELHWVILGEGPLRGALEAQVKTLRLGGVVHLAGRVENPRAFLPSADVFVMSSREEGLGTSILDAMAARVPIAATRAGGIPEMLEGGAGLLSPVGDGVALGRSVATLLEDPGAREAVLAGAAAALPHFTARAMADGVAGVYRSLNPND